MQQDEPEFKPDVRSVFITDQLPSLSTFGHADNGEGVFIPAVVARAAGISPGDTVTATLVPNSHNSQTPWFAVHVHGAGEEIPADAWDRLSDDNILAALQESPLTIREIADDLGAPRIMVQSRINSLFRGRRLVKSMVFADPRKGASPTAVLWGVSVEQFLGEEE